MAEEVVIKSVLDLSESAQKTQRQIEKALQAAEAKQIAHQRRLESIHLQSGARLQQIEARRLAQIDLIRERSVQKELEHQRKLERAVQSSAGAIGSFRVAVGALQGVFAALAALGVASLFERFGRAAVQAAIDINKQVNTLKALTGSAEAAEKRFAALFKIAQQTPGLTTNLALTLDAQLRVFSVAERTIDRLLPVIGKLNAISPLVDPRQFVNNFTQLISQNFERQDLKELVGQSPIAGLLIKEIFNVDNPTNAAAIRASAKRLGVTTVERLAEEFADAAANNSALRNATESFAGQFDKLQDRITVALAPIGAELLRTLLPAFKEFVELLERDLPKITALLRDNRDEFLAIAGAIVSVAGAVGQLIGEFQKLDQKFGIVRGLSLLAGSIISPGSTGALLQFFDRQDQQIGIINALDPVQRRALARSTGNKALEPSRQELIDFALGQGDLKLLAEVSKVTPPPRTGGGLVGGGRAGAISAEQRERDREIKDLIRKQSESITDRREQDRRDFDDLNRLLQVALVDEESRLRTAADRPAQLAAFGAATAERIAAIEAEDARLVRNTAKAAAEELAKVPPILSDSERFMQGFADATLSVGDAFEQFGNSVARAFGDVRNLFAGLKQAVLSFFNDLIGSTLQNLVRGVLGPIFGGGGGTGIGGFFQRAFAGAGGGGISAPASISGGVGSFFSGGGGGSLAFPGAQSPEFFNVSGGAGRTSFFGGIGKSFAAAAPLLGLGLGGSLGGQSIPGQIAGSAGGLLGGGAIAGFSGALGAKAAAFFTNPFTIAIGAGLLVGSFFLGRSKQRKQDEELSGQFLTQALQGIDQLAAAVASGQITTLAEARSIFDSQILATFRQQIGTLKTKSVRESRLNNQVRDLRNQFEQRIPPLILEQERRASDAARFAAIDRRLVPEFAFGGTVPGVDRGRDSVLSLLRPGELVLTRGQQASVVAQSNPGVFDRAGVPRGAMHTGGAQAFAFGGTAIAAPGGQSGITLFVQVGMSQSGAEEITAAALDSGTGKRMIVNVVQRAQLDKELN